jgi:MFS family permease
MYPLKKLFHRYNTPVIIHFSGAFITSMTGSMLAPFIMIYLHESLNGNLLLPMVIVGLQPLSDILFTLISGGITDRLGRKKIIVISLFIQAFAMAGFIFAGSVWAFAALYSLNGIGRSLFIPAQRAQLVDTTKADSRSEVFAVISTISSIGMTAGPLLGFLVYSHNPSIIFGLEAAALLFYMFIAWFKLPETAPIVRREIKEKATKLKAGTFFWNHHFVLGIMVFTLPVSFFYAQMETSYRLYIQDLFPNFLAVLTILTTAKGVMTIFLQVLLVKWTERYSMQKIIFISYCSYAVAAICLGFSTNLMLLLVAQLLLTIGESIGLNHLLRYVSTLAPEQNRGLYFSLYGIHWDISRTIGPFIGGLFLLHLGGDVLFFTSALLLVCGGIGQIVFISYIQKRHF